MASAKEFAGASLIVDRLIAYRKLYKMTQQDIADATGITCGSFHRLLNNLEFSQESC